jgi:hypothetical protein
MLRAFSIPCRIGFGPQESHDVSRGHRQYRAIEGDHGALLEAQDGVVDGTRRFANHAEHASPVGDANGFIPVPYRQGRGAGFDL